MSRLFGWSLVAFVLLVGLYGGYRVTIGGEPCGLRVADTFECLITR